LIEQEWLDMTFGAAVRGSFCVALICALAGVPQARPQDADELQARYIALREALADSPFHRPLYLESSEGGGELKGEVYARIDQPFAAVGAALQGMDRWCDILILHLNVKQCRAVTTTAAETLTLNIGRKFDQPLADTYLFALRYQVTRRPGYLRNVLSAPEGPLGTSQYRIVLEVAELDGDRSLLHLSYAYAQGAAARWATQIYLATLGRAKVGFSVIGRDDDGTPQYIGSTRGVVERNAMRSYLAIEAYLGSLSVPAEEQVEHRLNAWHAGTERYPRQLRELELDEYLAIKRVEIRRQQAPALVAGVH
jgi:hypothetical protein